MSRKKAGQSSLGVAGLLGNVPAALILILPLAFGLRTYGITFGTPFEGFYWWDECSALTKALTVASDPGPASLRLGHYPLE